MKITEIAGSAPTEVGTTFPFTLRIGGGPQSYTGLCGSVDSLGRMKGTIQRREVGNDYYDGPFSWTATFELEGVVRQKGIQ